MLKAKLGIVLSPVYLAMISIRVEAPKAKRRLPYISNSPRPRGCPADGLPPNKKRLSMSEESVSIQHFFKDNLWTVGFVSHCGDVLQIYSCICILLFKKAKKKGYNQRLIVFSYLVLGTRSAAKFEQVPSTSFKANYVCQNAPPTPTPRSTQNPNFFCILHLTLSLTCLDCTSGRPSGVGVRYRLLPQLAPKAVKKTKIRVCFFVLTRGFWCRVVISIVLIEESKWNNTLCP